MIRPEDEETGGQFTALVLAGRRGGDDPVARYCGVEHKCLAPAGGLPMLVRVVEALAASPSIGRIFVALEDPALLDHLPALRTWRERGRCRGLASAATPSLSVLAALEQIADALPVLVTTADHPLLSVPIVEQFCEAARASGADLVAGLTTAAVIRGAYPQSQRTYLRFRDARYSGANLFAILTPRRPAGGRVLAPGRAGAQTPLADRPGLRPWPAAGLFLWPPDAGRGHGPRLGGDRRLASRPCACPSRRPRSTSTSRPISIWSI